MFPTCFLVCYPECVFLYLRLNLSAGCNPPQVLSLFATLYIDITKVNSISGHFCMGNLLSIAAEYTVAHSNIGYDSYKKVFIKQHGPTCRH